MANEKQILNPNGTMCCSDCGEAKPFTNEYFPFQRKHKGQLLKRCKPCQNKRTYQFRKKNPDYWIGANGWFEKNKEHWQTYLEDNWKANKNGKIYSLTNPEGMVYIGYTQFNDIKKRLKVHINDYNAYTRGSRKKGIEKLYESFTKFGINNHTCILIEDLGHKNRYLGLQREKEYIQQYINKGISLNSIKGQ